MLRIGIATADDYLWQKIRLTLNGRADCERVSVGEDFEKFGLLLWDTDTLGQSYPRTAVTIGKSGELTTPLSFEDIISLTDRSERAPILTLGDGCVYLRGEKIGLTDMEFALFAALYSARGEFISRDELLLRIWKDATPGVLNVYIHYLREKLERGEKIIISSRKEGYKIDKRFIL